MSVNRVQKLLFSEYCDFEDMVLIESPFAQTTKEGKGIRQVHLGLTPSKLVLATDVLPPVEFGNCKYVPGVDPEIETFELIAIYPVECVNLSVYRRRKRQALKARFCNNKVTYFELGGFEKRGMFWNLWCEKVKFLCPVDSGSSKSETSVATSTTGSTLYLLDRRLVAANGIKQLWCKFGPNALYGTSLINEVIGNNKTGLTNKWTDKHLYMGKSFVDMSLQYQPIVCQPALEEFVKETQKVSRKALSKSQKSLIPYYEEKGLNFGDSVRINRFGSGIQEGCNTGLYLTVDDYIVPRRYSQLFDDNDSISNVLSFTNYEQIAESAVLCWEFYNVSDINKYKMRHKRRYGFAPKPLFLYGFGPWSVTPGARYSTQAKRAVSEIDLRKQPTESEMRLPISKRQLVATISSHCLNSETNNTSTGIMNAPKKPVTYFWTCNYWYRPKSAKESYDEQQRHLKKIYSFLENRSKKQKCKRKFLRKFYISSKEIKDTDEDSNNEEPYYKKSRKRKSGFIYNMFSRVEEIELGSNKHRHETSLQYLKRILKVDVTWSAWDFDSTILAETLTMIDRELLLKIPSVELGILVWQQNTKNAPNISAMLAFSYRTSCLIASEVLKDDSERTRARLVARFINVADKCYRISNFQSCRAVLSGLQSPAIYRLRRTWAYVRKKHASNIFEFLCRLFRDPRLPGYQKTFYIMSQNSPHLPYIGDIIVRLLNKVPEYRLQAARRSISRQSSFSTTKSHATIQSVHQIVHTQNLFTKILKAFMSNEVEEKSDQIKVRKIKKKNQAHRKGIKFKGLYEYFKPLEYLEDSRLECLEETKEFLEKCQLGAMNYNFNINSQANAYFLKARYTEDRENFYNSLRIEPPSDITSKRNK